MTSEALPQPPCAMCSLGGAKAATLSGAKGRPDEGSLGAGRVWERPNATGTTTDPPWTYGEVLGGSVVATLGERCSKEHPGACCQSRVWWSGGARCGVRAPRARDGNGRWAGTGGSNRGQARLRRGEGPNAAPPWPGWGAPLGQLLDVVRDGGAQRLDQHLVSPPTLRPPQPVTVLQFGVGRLDPVRARGAGCAWRVACGDRRRLGRAVPHRPGARGCGRPPGAALRLDRARPADLRPPAVDQATGRPGSARGALAGEEPARWDTDSD